MITKNEFILATPEDDESPGLWGYNIRDKRWKYVIKYDPGVINMIEHPSITYNPDKNEAYIYSGSDFYGINLLTKEQIKYNSKINTSSGANGNMLFVNNFVHIIGCAWDIVN